MENLDYFNFIKENLLKSNDFNKLYDNKQSLITKINKICLELYSLTKINYLIIEPYNYTLDNFSYDFFHKIKKLNININNKDFYKNLDHSLRKLHLTSLKTIVICHNFTPKIDNQIKNLVNKYSFIYLSTNKLNQLYLEDVTSYLYLTIFKESVTINPKLNKEYIGNSTFNDLIDKNGNLILNSKLQIIFENKYLDLFSYLNKKHMINHIDFANILSLNYYQNHLLDFNLNKATLLNLKKQISSIHLPNNSIIKSKYAIELANLLNLNKLNAYLIIPFINNRLYKIIKNKLPNCLISTNYNQKISSANLIDLSYLDEEIEDLNPIEKIDKLLVNISNKLIS